MQQARGRKKCRLNSAPGFFIMQVMEQIIFAVVIILSIAVWFDLKTDKVPNLVILAGYILGAFLQIDCPVDILRLLGNILFPIAMLYPLFLLKGLGAGDIKLFSFISIFYSHEGLIKIMIYSLFIGAGICIINRLFCRLNPQCKAKRYIHYTVCILTGYLVFVVQEGKWL